MDDAVRSWRDRLARRRWFFPAELDELEDHLRSHATNLLEVGPTLSPDLAFEAAVREEVPEATALFREFAKSERPGWRLALLAGWGLYALSFVVPGFGIVAFESSSAAFGLSASGWEFLRLALTNGWILVLLPHLAMILTLSVHGRTRLGIEPWLRRALGAVSLSALGFGVLNYLRPLAVTVDGDLVMYGHLGPGYWAWFGSWTLVGAALWSRAREWEPAQPRDSVA